MRNTASTEQRLHELVKLLAAVRRLARHLLAEDPLAAGGFQSIDLRRIVLGVG